MLKQTQFLNIYKIPHIQSIDCRIPYLSFETGLITEIGITENFSHKKTTNRPV